MNYSKKNHEYRLTIETMVSKTKLTILALLISLVSIAQTGINYKALIKDTNGNVITNQGIDIVFSIQHESVTQYSELQQIVTDNNGIAIATIGEGSPITGTFDTIDWKLRNLELNVQIDLGDGLVDFGNTPFNAVPYAINTLKPQGLEALDQGNGIGWRIATGSNPDYYGNIGAQAIDLSFQGPSSNRGATGLFSFASGAATFANATYSVAFGEASNSNGRTSFATGGYTTASGNYTTAMGRSTNAEAYASTAIGRYNIGGGNPTTWGEFDPIFEIGNGTSNSNRSNALTVSKNGRMSLNSTSSGFIVDSEGIYGFRVSGDNLYGIDVLTATRYGGFFRGNDAAIYAEADINANPDIILGGDSGNANDDGIIASDPSYAESDIYLRSNDAVVVQLDHDNSGNGNFYIQDSDGDEVFSVNEVGNVNIEGDVTGLRVRSSISSNPDIILRGNGSGNSQDDGIIVSDPLYPGSDIYLRSNDALVVELDNDNNGSGSFLIRNGNQDVVLDVTESGNLSFDGTLELGTGIVESPSPDIRIETNDDAFIILDNDNNELGFFGIYNGSASTSNVVFQVLDSGDALLAGNLTQLSDRRLKRDIEDLSYGLKEILQLNPKQYHWKDKMKNKKSLGLIAQEVKSIIENIVNTQDNEEKTLGISYTELIPVLINAIKEQNKIIESQGEALKTSKNNYEALLSRIEILESKSSN